MFKMKVISGVVIASAVLSMGAMSTMTAFAAESDIEAESKITATIKGGGMSLDLTAIDALTVDLGDLVIGDAIPEKTIPSFLTVKDLSGGDGWVVTVNATNFNDTKDNIKNTITMTNTYDSKAWTPVAITDAAANAVGGLSKNADQTVSGKVTSAWGVSPEDGKSFVSNLQWTLTADTTGANSGN